MRFEVANTVTQRAPADPLIGPRAPADDRHGRVGRQPSGEKLAGPAGDLLDPHVDGERPGERRQGFQIDRASLLLGLMPGDDREHRRGGATRQRHVGRRRRRQHGGDPRNDPEADAGGAERGGLLGKSAEDTGIPPLEPHDAPSGRGELDEESPGRLTGVAVGGMTGNGDPDRPGAGQIEDQRGDECIVDDRVGGAEELEAAEGEEVGVARPRPDKPHAAGVGDRVDGGWRPGSDGHDLPWGGGDRGAAIGTARSGPLRGAVGRATL